LNQISHKLWNTSCGKQFSNTLWLHHILREKETKKRKNGSKSENKEGQDGEGKRTENYDMENEGSIDSLITDKTVTLYWEKQESFLDKDYYRISFNQEVAGITEKTHYEFSDLEPDTVYSIGIQWMRGEKMISHETVRVKTQKQKKILDITKPPYHAVGDGKTINTETIQQAIEDCDEYAMVYIPEGVFLTGSLRLHSNMEIYLERGAVLQGTARREDYLPMIPSRFEGIEMLCYSSLLNLGEMRHKGGYNCRNVVIRGEGTIAGGGRSLAEKVIAYETENLRDYLASLGAAVQECEKPETIPGRLRPRLINISNCQKVSISGLTLKDGASWNVHMIYSDNVVTDHCVFRSENVWNGDGWDPDSSTNCTIFACIFYTGDDSIAIKSGKNPEGNQVNRPCRNIRIFDCICKKGHGFAIGSEMSGGVENVKIWDCDLRNSIWGLEIKGTKKRGGYVRDIHVRNCVMPRILFHSVGYNDDGAAAPMPPVFEKCSFTDVAAEGVFRNQEGIEEKCAAVELCGFDTPGYEIRDVLFRRVRLPEQRDGGQIISLKYCKNIRFDELSCGF
jgi:exo-poly-alpha-galacturonosidase